MRMISHFLLTIKAEDNPIVAMFWRIIMSESANASPILQNTPKPRLPRERGGPLIRPYLSLGIRPPYRIRYSNTETKGVTHTWIPAFAGKTVGERTFQRHSQTPKPTETPVSLANAGVHSSDPA